MATAVRVGLSPRKSPVQSRSAETVEAIFEGTIQVLLGLGSGRLTTTRVAARAGVSVGTLYQYFPNKQALLYALLDRHLNLVAEAVEQACAREHGCPLRAMMEALVNAYVGAKLRRADVSRALYKIWAELDGSELSLRAAARSRAAVAAMLSTAPDLHLAEPDTKAGTLVSAMAGAARAYLEAGGNLDSGGDLRRELLLLGCGYLQASGGN